MANYINLILNIVFISIFIGVFYFVYVINVEKQIIQSQADYIAADFSTYFNWFPDSFKNIINNIPISSISSDILTTTQITSNNKLKQLTFNVLMSVLVIGFLLIFLLQNDKTKLYVNIFYAVITLISIGITEWMFLSFVISNFISADPNFVKYTFFNILNKKINNV